MRLAVKKFLIVKTSSLGDIIQSFPVLRLLRKLYPDCEIDWVVEKPFADLLYAHPDVSGVIEVETKFWRKNVFKKAAWVSLKKSLCTLRQKKYDAVFDLQGNIKSALLSRASKSQNRVGYNFSSVPEWPNALFHNRRFPIIQGKNIREDYLELILNYSGSLGDKEEPTVQLKINPNERAMIESLLDFSQLKGPFRVMVCPGSNWPNKQLSQITLQKFLMLLSETYDAKFLFVWGSSSEYEYSCTLANLFPGSSHVVEKLRLPVLQNLMTSVELVIAMDSLALHLAGTTKTPSFSCFGPSSAKKYRPLALHHKTIQGQCPYNQQFEKRCSILRTCSTGACMKGFEVNPLFEEFSAWWEGHRKLNEHEKS